jgi:hypothetical protein
MSYISGKDRGFITYLSCVNHWPSKLVSPGVERNADVGSWGARKKRVADMTKVAISAALEPRAIHARPGE